MVLVLNFSINKPNMNNIIKKVQLRVEKFSENINHELGSITELELKKYLKRRSKRFEYRIFQSIKSKKKNKYDNNVKMALAGIYLDSMKPQWVKLKKGRAIRRWALQGRMPQWLKDKAKNQQSIYVKPHPFVADALESSKVRYQRRIKYRLRRYLKDEI